MVFGLGESMCFIFSGKAQSDIPVVMSYAPTTAAISPAYTTAAVRPKTQHRAKLPTTIKPEVSSN